MTAREIERLVSAERFAPFRRATSHPRDALALYTWNAKVSGAFAEVLHHVEVLVRNAMHHQMTALHSQVPGRPRSKAWFDEPDWAKHHWFHQHAKEQIAKAIRRAGHRPHKPNPGKVVAALNLGFWRYLASPRYEQSFWVPALDRAFAAPGTRAQDRRKAVEHRLAFLHLLRNRISHCEPIIHPVQYNYRGQLPTSKTLDQMYTDSIDLIGFISPVAANWLKHETRGLLRLLRTYRANRYFTRVRIGDADVFAAVSADPESRGSAAAYIANSRKSRASE